MYTKSVSTVNFNSGYRFKNMPVEAKKELPKLINKGKVIFENFEKKGDVFLVARNSYDDRLINFIKEKRLDFEFYPTISTDLMVQDNPQKLSQILLDLNSKPIRTINGIRETIKERFEKVLQEKSPKHVINILKTLCIDNVNPIENYKNGLRIVDKEFARTIYITKPSSWGMHYVKITPSDKNSTVNRYMMDADGNILAKFDTPDAIRLFGQRLSELMKI